MNKWEQVSFADAVRSRGSGSSGLPQSEWTKDGEFPVIGQGSEDIEGWTNRADLVLTPNPAVVLYGGHTRRAKFVNRPFVPGPNVKILEPTAGLDAKFLFYFLAQLPIESRGYADHFPEVRRCSIPLPLLAEQRRIVEVLDGAKALQVQRRAALAQLDSLIQSLFLDLIGDPVTNERNWLVSPIGELDIQIADGNYSSKYPTSSQFVESGVPFIRANNLRDLTVVADDLRFISPAKHRELQKGHLAEGDVLITTRGEIGNIALVPRCFHDANINAQIVLLRPNGTQLDSRYLAYLLNLSQMKIRLQSYQNGVALKQLPIRQLVRVPIPVPPIELQREFARRVTAVEKLKTAQRASLASLNALFATLQHRSFRGEL